MGSIFRDLIPKSCLLLLFIWKFYVEPVVQKHVNNSEAMFEEYIIKDCLLFGVVSYRVSYCSYY